MIELKWSDLRTPEFQMAMTKLMNANNLPFKTSYHVSRIGAKCQSEVKESDQHWLKLAKKYADINEKTGQFKVKEEHLEIWNKETGDFGETKFTIDKRKLSMSELEPVGLTPNEILALEPLISVLELTEGVENGKESSEKSETRQKNSKEIVSEGPRA